ncbi:hypothetical protein [Haladaptatus sp. DYF46]|uniref:hypothetical protein n=1 Tax=Haladaptatus sp. DYF46 TaxID=2886041 RepID=UPI001E2EE3DA|nr:hypothetical protein [Haladaptatus sp. DYF46]
MGLDSGNWIGMDDEGMLAVNGEDDGSADSETSVRETMLKATILLLVIFASFFLFAWVMFG